MGSRGAALLMLTSLAGGCGRVGFDPGPDPTGDGGTGEGGLIGDAADGVDAAVTCMPTAFTCVDEDLGTASGTITSGTTTGAGDDQTGSCGGGGELDRQFQWTSPTAGRWLLDTHGSTFDTVLYVRDACAGTQLACNDDDIVGGSTSVLTLDLAACTSLFIVVDSLIGSGAFDLSARRKCPATVIGSALGAAVATGSTTGWGDSYTSSCGGGGEADVTVSWTAPTTGRFAFSTQGSTFDTVLSARSSCAGAVLGCNDDDSGGGSHSRLQLDLTAGEQVVLVIDSIIGSGTYQLAITAI